MAENNKQVQEIIFDKPSFKQVIYSQPRKIFVKRYLTAKGVRLVNAGTITPEEADNKYGKNLYRLNPNAKPIKTIDHQLTTKTKIHLGMIYPKNGVLGRKGNEVK